MHVPKVWLQLSLYPTSEQNLSMIKQFYGAAMIHNYIEQLCCLKQWQNNFKDAVTLYDKCTKQHNI